MEGFTSPPKALADSRGAEVEGVVPAQAGLVKVVSRLATRMNLREVMVRVRVSDTGSLETRGKSWGVSAQPVMAI